MTDVILKSVFQIFFQEKRTYNGLPDFMTKLAAEELERLSDDIQECNVIYLPQVGNSWDEGLYGHFKITPFPTV